MSGDNEDYDGMTAEEADRISYWADWAELNIVAPDAVPHGNGPPAPPGTADLDQGPADAVERMGWDDGRSSHSTGIKAKL